MFKRALVLAPSLLVLVMGLWIGPKYDRFVLPAFDGHVYAAMAENPRVFTLAPWGYRILEPWLVSLLPFSSAGAGFFWVNLFLLAGAVAVISWWLRRLGFSPAAAGLAATLFGISPPMRVLLNYQILVDPLALLILAFILVELLEPEVLTLMALFAAAALTKETLLLSLCVIPFFLIRRSGWLRGLVDSVVVAAPGVFLGLLLRAIWGNPAPATGFSIWDVTLGRLVESGASLASAAFLSGLLLPAVVGLVRENSIELRVQAVLLWFFTFSLIVVNPYHYSVSDLPRLSLFAWPAMLPLALSGVGFKRSPSPLGPRFVRFRMAASVVTLLSCLALVGATDSYNRAPFPATIDAVALVGRVRETLKTARALQAGDAFTFDARSGRFATAVEQPFNLTEGRRQRWFLYRGFGADPAFGSGIPEFRGLADFLFPMLVPRSASLLITLESRSRTDISVIVAGRKVGSVRPNGSSVMIGIGSELLFRGDNVVRLRGPPDVTVRFVRLEMRLQPPSRLKR